MGSPYSPDAIHGCYEAVKAVIGSSCQLGGIYADKAGYHNCRNQLPGGDYSVQQPYDQGGDGWASSGLDITPGSTSWMRTMTQHMIDETKANGDSGALRGVREFFGTLDGYTVTGMDVPGRYWVTSDDSHLWHVHVSGKRENVNDHAAWADVAAILTGEETDMPLNDNDAATVWNHNIRLWNESTPDAYFVLSAIHQYLQTDRLRAVAWDAPVELWNGTVPRAETVLSNLHQSVHAILDRLDAIEAAIGADT